MILRRKSRLISAQSAEIRVVAVERKWRKVSFWHALASTSLKERQRKVLNLMFDGFKRKLTSSKWAKITHCSQDSAYRDILDLLTKGILIKNLEGGRSTSYSLVIPKTLS